MTRKTLRAILNEYNAGANQYVYHDTVDNKWVISQDATVASPVDLFPPIHEGQTLLAGVDVLTSQLETTALSLLIDDNFNGIPQVVSASTNYKIEFDWSTEKQETGLKGPRPYTYQSPVVLTGNAATDRLNMYTVLVAKINNDAYNNVSAQLVSLVAFTLGQDSGGTGATGFATQVATNKVTYGSPGLQSTSGATVNIAGCVITSGTIAGNDAAGYIYVYNLATAAWAATVETTVFTDALSSEAIVVTTNAALTTGQGLIVIDDAGYYPARPNPRRGATSVYAVKSSFTMARPSLVRVPLYGRGYGTRMLQDWPAYDLGGQNVVSGDANFTVNALPVAGYTYTAFVIHVHTSPSPDPISNMTQGNTIDYVLWAKENATVNGVGTAPAQLATDLQTIV